MRTLACCFLLALLSSCSNKVKLLSRHWDVTDVVFTEGGALTEVQQRKFAYDLEENFRFRFLADGAYITVNKQDTLHGKWLLSEDEKVVYNIVGFDTSSAQIIALSKKHLSLQPLQGIAGLKEIVSKPLKATK